MKNLVLKILIVLFLIIPFPQKMFALTASHIAFVDSGQMNNVISNEHFLDIDSMTLVQIQNFLNTNNSYLKNFTDTSEVGRGRTAAQIIFDAAHGKYEAGGSMNGITVNETTGTVNPEVILLYLQKEQSLITRTTYDEWSMTAAMGYFCYAGVTGDNNGNNCKDIYEGFTKQIENGAWQLRYNYIRSSGSGFSDYQVGQVFTTSDGYDVTLTNRATASVYRYTPYVYYSAYNVWNLFYNTFNFDAGGVVVPPAEEEEETDENEEDVVQSSNDVTPFSYKTYNGSYQASGTKRSDVEVYFNNSKIAKTGVTSWNLTIEPTIGKATYAVVYKNDKGSVVGTKNIEITRNKIADINGDGTVDIQDLSIFANYWGQTNPPEIFVDMNSDSTVDIIDLSTLASNWNG